MGLNSAQYWSRVSCYEHEVSEKIRSVPLGQPGGRLRRIIIRLLLDWPSRAVEEPFASLDFGAKAQATHKFSRSTTIEHVWPEQVVDLILLFWIDGDGHIEVSWVIHEEPANEIMKIPDTDWNNTVRIQYTYCAECGMYFSARACNTRPVHR